MSERRYTAVFTVALLIAAAATYGVYRVLRAAEQGNQVASRAVVVALRDLPEGVVIDRTSIGTRNVPIQAIPRGAFATVDSVVGRVTRIAVFSGEAIVPGRLASLGTLPGIGARIAPGMRAVGVRINDVASASGFIQPNSRVDVMVTLARENIAKIFLENVRVLSVGEETQRVQEGTPIRATTATLELSPEQAEQLALAQRQGTIQLVLRGAGDQNSVNTAGARTGDVLPKLREPVTSAPSPRPAPPRPRPRPKQDTIPAKVVTPPPPPPQATVEVIRGTKTSTQKFDTTSSDKSP